MFWYTFKVIKTLLDNGMSIQRVRRAWRYLSKNGDLTEHLSEVKLVSDGSTIYSVGDEEVFDALKNGQLTFFETIDNSIIASVEALDILCANVQLRGPTGV